MNSAPQAPTKARPKYYDANPLHLPASGLLSIFHCAGGAVMFLVLVPLLLIISQRTLRSESGFMEWETVLAHPFAKLVLLGFAWANRHHFLAGRAAWLSAFLPTRASRRPTPALAHLKIPTSGSAALRS